jgi:hypothetical protein
MLGAVLSMRGRETIIELWFNYFKYERIKNGVAIKIKSLLQVDSSVTVYFKDNEQSLTVINFISIYFFLFFFISFN